MLRSVYFWIFVGLVGFILTMFEVHVFSWKDTRNVERVVLVPRSPKQSTDVPPFPESLDQNQQLEHSRDVWGLGNYLVKLTKKLFSKENGTENQTASNTRQYPQTHRVSKETMGPEADEPLSAPALPENTAPQESSRSTSIGTNVTTDSVNGAAPFLPKPIQKDDRNPLRLVEFPDALLVASFNIDPWNEEDMKQPKLLQELISVMAQFDFIAVQGFKTNNMAMLEDLAQKLSAAANRKYDFVAATGKMQTTPNDPVQAFFYDTTKVETDPNTVCCIGKYRQPFAFPPLVAKFRAKKAPAEQAFTFYAVNLDLYPLKEAQEFAHLPEIIQTVHQMQPTGTPKEDDFLFFGHFGPNPEVLQKAQKDFCSKMKWSNSEPTNTWRTYMTVSENILFCAKETSECTDGCGGIWRLDKHFKRDDGIPFDFHPVWLKLSIYEGP